MTDAQTEARAILRKVLAAHRKGNSASAPIATALAAKNEELAVVKSKCQALDDECQQSMLDISRERDRAERAEAQLADAIDLLGSSLCEMAPISAANHKRRVIEFITAHRAREAQGGENG